MRNAQKAAFKIDENKWSALEKLMTARVYRGKHVKKCECMVCTRKKLKDYEQRTISVMSEGAMPTKTRYIPVHGYFRGNKKAYKNDPVFLKCVETVVKRILKARGL